MTPRRWRLATLTAAGAILLAIALLAAGYAIAAVALQQPEGTSPHPGELRSTLRKAFTLWSALIVPAAAALGWWLGQRLALPFRLLRRSLLQRTDVDPASEFPVSRIAEAAGIAAAAGLSAGRARTLAASSDRERRAVERIIAGAAEGLLQIDADGRVRYANPASRSLLDLPAEVVGQPLTAIVRNAGLRNVVTRALAGELVKGREVTFGDRPLLVSGQPLARAEGRADKGAVLSISDLTVLRRLEGVRRDFVANASHELKTPLTAIRGYTDTLLQGDTPGERQREFLETIQRNADRLQHIVDDLLDLSRLDAGGWQPELQPLNLGDTVRAVWQDFRERADARQVGFIPPASDALVLADATALAQVLSNIFDNALRFTPHGGTITATIESVRATAGEPGALLKIADTGTGIPRAALPRIFERFYRADTARSRAAGGTGLGLAIVKHLVEAMGGEVSADSRPGLGTTIRITLRSAS